MGIRDRLKLHKNEQYIPKPREKKLKKPKGPIIPKGRTLSEQDRAILFHIRHLEEQKRNELRAIERVAERIKFETAVELTEEIKNICEEYKINTNNRILEVVRCELERFLHDDIEIDNYNIKNTYNLYQSNDFLQKLFNETKDHRFEKCLKLIAECVNKVFNLINDDLLCAERVITKRLLEHAGFEFYYCIAKIYSCREEYDDEDDYDFI